MIRVEAGSRLTWIEFQDRLETRIGVIETSHKFDKTPWRVRAERTTCRFSRLDSCTMASRSTKAIVFHTSVPSMASLAIVVTKRSMTGLRTARPPNSRADTILSPGFEGRRDSLPLNARLSPMVDCDIDIANIFASPF